MSSFEFFGARDSHQPLLMVMVLTSLTSVAVLSACDDDEPKSTSSIGDLADRGVECEVKEGDCPNACTYGTGILGEQCSDTTSCGCGLFCDESRCQPYRGAFQGCACEGDTPQALSFVDRCNAETEGAPCNDLNPCTIDDQCAQGRCLGSPTPYPAACDDGNSCTSGDICAGAVCQGSDKADGERCDDGSLCTETDRCSSGQCLGDTVECSSASNQCNLGICDPQTGSCFSQPKPIGEICDDGNYCTLNDQCESGSCVATERVDCSGVETACLSSTCDPLSGACLLTDRADGLYCDSDDNACTQEQCQDGECITQYTVQCEELCNDGLCDPNTGQCTGQALPNGTACDDQDACTENSECRGGVCFITDLLCACDNLEEGALCDDGNECTIESRCNAEGECVELGFAEVGVACDLDGNQCTVGQCDGEGVCRESEPLDCSDIFREDEIGQCQAARCLPESGACSIVAIDNGISCSTEDLCDEEGICQAGLCVTSTRDCSSLNQECGEGICDPTTGACTLRAFPEGTPCEDGDLCTAAGRCNLSGGELTCQDQVIDAVDDEDLCDVCVGMNEGDACDDGNACTEESSCVRRGSLLVCLGAQRSCERDSFEGELNRCQRAMCDPLTGECSIAQDMPVGSRCNDGLLCTRQDRCTISGDVLTCTGIDQQADTVTCPEGTSLLNPSDLDQSSEDLGLVDQCADRAHGQSAETSHQVSELLSPNDPEGKILSNLDRDRTEEWFSLQLNAPEHLSLKVTDRCGAPLPVVLSILNATGTRDLSGAQRVSTMLSSTRLDLDITESAEYLVKVDLARSLSLEEVEVPYVLHISSVEHLSCLGANDCCIEERCDPLEEGESEALFCQSLTTREDGMNDRPSAANRLLFIGDIKQAKRVGALSDRFEEDWYKVRLQANHVYDFTVQGYCSKPIDTFLNLYSDPTQPPIMVNDNHNGLAESLWVGSSKIRGVVSEQTTDYYLKVEGGPQSNDPYGSYTIIAEDVSCNPSAERSECLCAAQHCVAISENTQVGQCLPRYSEREPNQNEATARENDNRLVLDSSFIGHIDRVGDRDTYLISLPAGRFKIKTSAYCDVLAINTSLRVMNLAGLTLAEDQDSGEGRLAAIEELAVLTAQDYLIEVSGAGGSVGAYQLEVITLSLDDGTGEMSGLCVVDSDCQCPDFACRVQEDGARACEPRVIEAEPNEQRFDATPLSFGERMTGQLNTITDLDLYRINISQDLLGESVVFAIDTACDGLGVEAQLRLLDGNGVELMVGNPWRDGYLVATTPYEVNQTGVVYLEVSSSIASRGSYVITSGTVIDEDYIPLDQRTCFNDDQCQCPTLRCNAAVNTQGQCLAIGARELEPNDTADQARVINIDESMMGSLTGSLSSALDVDHFTVDFGPEDLWRRFSITVSNVCEQPTPPQVRFQVFNPQGVLLFDREGTANSPPVLERATISAMGRYLIVVQYAEGAIEGDHKTYRLELSPELGCEDPSEASDQDPEAFCLCEDLLCDDRDIDGCLSPEIEPNSLPSFPQRLSVSGQDYSGSRVYGRVDDLGDRDFYSLSFSEGQRGGLFKVDLLPFCQQSELPLALTAFRPLTEETLLSEDANGESRSDADRSPIGGGIIRAEGDLPLMIDVNLSPLDGVESPVSGEYILDISPVSCAVDEDCLCETVSCQESECRADYGEGEPNNQVEHATEAVDVSSLGLQRDMIISGHLGGLTQGEGAIDELTLDESDFWLLPRLELEPTQTASIRIRAQSFCEAPQLETFLSLKARAESELDYVTQVLTEAEDEDGPYYEALITRSGDHVLEVSLQNTIGSYQFSVSVNRTIVVLP